MPHSGIRLALGRPTYSRFGHLVTTPAREDVCHESP